MARYDLAQRARTDLDNIADFTMERWGRRQAVAYVEALRARLQSLAARPGMGRRREELASGLLSFPFESHVIFYRPTPDGIVVVRLLHGRQDADRAFD